MSRTFKDYKIKQELAKIVREKKAGPHKEKRWVICSSCKGKGYEIDGFDCEEAKCDRCKGEGIVYE